MRRFLLPLLTALTIAAALPAAASATVGPCVPEEPAGPQCQVWTGKVTRVSDGDTVDVDVAGDGTRKPIRVRMIGLQAMEQSTYSANEQRRRGECHALEATQRLISLVRPRRRTVRIAALDPSSKTGVRWRRSVAIRVNGRWSDVGRRMISEGHALFLPNGRETAYNRAYNRLAQEAASKGLGIWNPGHCGIGPSENAPLKLWVNWDADGADERNLNGEWVKVKNFDPVNAVPLARWWIRDSHLRRYTFPAGASIGPGQTMTFYVGSGTDTATSFYWGLDEPVFENVTNDERAMGDGAYLFDPDGDLRAWMTYPCRASCTDPFAGALEISVEPRGREYISVANVSDRPVDLEGYRLASEPYGYPFGPRSVLQPGEVMRIQTGGSPQQDTRLFRHWGQPDPILDNAGDVVRLTTFDEIDLDCFAWGRGAC